MLRSYWSKHRKTGLTGLSIIAALIIGFGIIEQGVSRDAMYERQANESSREYARNTDEQIRQSCFPLAGIAKMNCIQKEREEYRTERRNELDLVAQRKSANWALIMGGAAVLGMVLSVVGVILVWITFRATKEANEIARRGQRAWLQISADIEDVYQQEKQVAVSYVVTVKNVGSDIAKDVQFEAALFRFFATVDAECDAFFAAPLSDHRPYKRPRSILPNGETMYRSVAHLLEAKIGDIVDSGNRRIYTLLFAAKVNYRANQDISDGYTYASFNLTHAHMGAFRYHPGEHYARSQVSQSLGQYNDAR